jgi:hypothetical protein
MSLVSTAPRRLGSVYNDPILIVVTALGLLRLVIPETVIEGMPGVIGWSLSYSGWAALSSAAAAVAPWLTAGIPKEGRAGVFWALWSGALTIWALNWIIYSISSGMVRDVVTDIAWGAGSGMLLVALNLRPHEIDQSPGREARDLTNMVAAAALTADIRHSRNHLCMVSAHRHRRIVGSGDAPNRRRILVSHHPRIPRGRSRSPRRGHRKPERPVHEPTAPPPESDQPRTVDHAGLSHPGRTHPADPGWKSRSGRRDPERNGRGRSRDCPVLSRCSALSTRNGDVGIDTLRAAVATSRARSPRGTEQNGAGSPCHQSGRTPTRI